MPTKAGMGGVGGFGGVVPRAEGKKELSEETQKREAKPKKTKKLENPGPKLYLHSQGASRGERQIR